MYAKIFSQIFESSIANNYKVRHIFMDLLVLADRTGRVDMTPESIARRINVPLREVKSALSALSAPDDASRADCQEGRRIILIDSHRDWGWQIVNFEAYHKVRDENGRREMNRLYKRRSRERQANQSAACQQMSAMSACQHDVSHGQPRSAHVDVDVDVDTYKDKDRPSSSEGLSLSDGLSSSALSQDLPLRGGSDQTPTGEDPEADPAPPPAAGRPPAPPPSAPGLFPPEDDAPPPMPAVPKPKGKVKGGGKPKAPPKPRESDPYFDGLARIFNIDPKGTGGSRLGRAKKLFLEHGATIEEVETRADNYRVLHPDWTCSPEAVEKHWGSLDVLLDADGFVIPQMSYEAQEAMCRPEYGWDWVAPKAPGPTIKALAAAAGVELRAFMDWRKAYSDKHGRYTPENPVPKCAYPGLEVGEQVPVAAGQEAKG